MVTLFLTIALSALLVASSPPAQPDAGAIVAGGCSFVRGFRLLHDRLPQVVGDCIANEAHDPTTGDATQATTRGLLVWRKIDNTTAFTDGRTTWIDGPCGLQSRPDDQRFAWELNAATSDRPLFSPTSPWNQPASGRVDPSSAAMIGTLRQDLDQQPFTVTVGRYGVSLYYSDDCVGWTQVGDSSGWWGGGKAPLPSGARAAPGPDQHIVIWDLSTNALYEFWGLVQKGNGSWTARYGISFDASGDGYQDGDWQNSARAYGGSLIAGVIRYAEMRNGVIPHALALAYPSTRGDRYARAAGAPGVWGIASHNDNDPDPRRQTAANIPEGARLRLKASVDLDARCGGNRASRVIGQALKDYGAFVVDTAGTPLIYAEDLRGKAVSWDGLLGQADAASFRADDFEVLALPPLTRSPGR